MTYIPSSLVYIVLAYQICIGASVADNSKKPGESLVPTVPQLPTGPITETTVDCVNSKFFKIQRENPQLKTWLLDVQGTVERLFAVRKKCDGVARQRQSECVSAWTRAAGVQFLRLGFSLFDQNNTDGRPLEILNTFVRDFQGCW